MATFIDWKIKEKIKRESHVHGKLESISWFTCSKQYIDQGDGYQVVNHQKSLSYLLDYFSPYYKYESDVLIYYINSSIKAFVRCSLPNKNFMNVWMLFCAYFVQSVGV